MSTDTDTSSKRQKIFPLEINGVNVRTLEDLRDDL